MAEQPCHEGGLMTAQPCERDADELAKNAGTLVQAITSNLQDLCALAEEMQDAETLLSLLYDIRLLKQETQKTFKQVQGFLFPVMGEAKITVEPYGEFVSHRGMKRSGWQYAELVPVLVARALDERTFDPETGEATEREAETVARVLLECLSLSGGKVRALRARGITPADFCTEEPKAWSVELPKAVDDDDLGLEDEAA